MAKKGSKVSEETRKKMSDARKGKAPWNKGKKGDYITSEATKKKLRGRTPWNKGKTGIYSEETKKTMGAKNIGIAAVNKGKPMSEEQRKKMEPVWEKNKENSPWNKGIPMSEEAKKKLSSKLKGTPAWNKGTPMSEEAKKKVSLSKKGTPPWNKGKPMSEERRKEMEPVWEKNRNYKHTTQAIEKITERRRRQIFPQKDTFPEVYIQKLLDEAKIEFEKHVPLMGQPDIFIKPNFLIFSDGDYWHCNPKPHFIWNYKKPSNLEDLTSSDMNSLLKGKKMEPGWEPNQILSGGQTAKMKWASDKKVTKTLVNQGYIVLRFWDSEFFGKPTQCIEKIQKTIKA